VETPLECIPALLEAMGIQITPITHLQYLTLLQGLQATRAQASLLFQLWTGHIALGSHLHCIKKAASPQCPGCSAPQESVVHYLFECPAHLHERIHHFCQWCCKERNLSFLLLAPKAALSIVGYVRDTERLESSLGKLCDRI